MGYSTEVRKFLGELENNNNRSLPHILHETLFLVAQLYIHRILNCGSTRNKSDDFFPPRISEFQKTSNIDSQHQKKGE